MPDYVFVSTLVGVGGFIVALVTLVKNSQKDSENHAEFNATIGTKLDFISEDVKDVKAEQRNMQRSVNEVRDIAIRARESADAAHRRLDRAGIEEGYSSSSK